MNLFLKAKHWQMFLLTFGLPMTFQFIFFGVIATSFINQTNPDPFLILDYVKFFPLVMIAFMVTFFGWFWAVATGLQKKMPKDVTMKVKKFKILFIIPMVYLLLFLLFMSIAISGIVAGKFFPTEAIVGTMIALILPLHFLSVFCIFYLLYFVAKTIKTVELQREVAFSDFVAEFFLIWFYPVGIWIIQPRINKMIED